MCMCCVESSSLIFLPAAEPGWYTNQLIFSFPFSPLKMRLNLARDVAVSFEP